jgi:hypothetical protein
MTFDGKSNTGIVVGGKDRPCDACRKRKSRCAMNEATKKCYSCDFHRQDCTFLENPQSRKKRTETGINPSEIDNRYVTMPNQLDCPNMLSFFRASQQTRRSSNSSSNVSLNGYPQSITQSNNTSGSSTPSLTFSHLQTYQLSQHIGRTTEIEPLLLDHLPLDQNDESRLHNGRVRKYGDDGTFMKVLDGDRTQAEVQAIALNEIESIVSPHGADLIHTFFSFVHPTFPILSEAEFRDLHKSRKRIDAILLCSVYILALNWWDVSGPVASRKPDVNRLESIAASLLPNALFRPRISTIQAGLLLSQRPHMSNSALTSQLITAGFELGLHQDCSTWKIPSLDKGLRKRIAWALYMQDKWCALVHGRPSHIAIANWTVKSLTEEDFEDSQWESGPGGSVPEGGNGPVQFNQMICLTGILSDILDTFYTLRAAEDFRNAGNGRTRLILEKAKPVQIKLKEWFSKLPSCLKMDATPGDQFSSTGSLHLAYFAAEITLHRCIIRSLDTTTADPYLFHICRSAAKTRLISAMDFVNRLRVPHLQSFWYFASRTSFALVGAFGMLLRATAPTMEEADFYMNRLDEYRWTLCISSKSADFLNFAVESLDAASGLLKNVPEKPAFADMMSSASSAGNATSMENMFTSQDEQMLDAPKEQSGYFDEYSRPEIPRMTSSTASGLASPATSSSSSSNGNGAFASPYRQSGNFGTMR